MEKKNTTHRPTRAQLVVERDRLVAELRYRPANGVPARGREGKFLSAAEVAERTTAIIRLNAAIRAAEANEKAARARRPAELLEDSLRRLARADWERSPEGQRRASDLAQKAQKGKKRAAEVVSAYRAATPVQGVRKDARARKAAVNGWDLLVESYHR